MPSYDDDLRLAHVLADAADSLTMARFQAPDLTVETKADQTPVSDADRSVEEAIRRTLARARPRDAVHGEEYDDTGHGPRRWILDPIDGTKNFVRGVPVWATLIALQDGDEVVAGLVSAPSLHRRWWAARGSGAFTGKSIAAARRMAVSAVASLDQASLSFSSLGGWSEHGLERSFLSLHRSVWRTRGYGDFWSYMLVAEGGVDIAVEPDVAVHDLAAPAVIVGEAGGRFTNLAGQPGPAGGSAVATNGLLHDEVLHRLAPAERKRRQAPPSPPSPPPISQPIMQL